MKPVINDSKPEGAPVLKVDENDPSTIKNRLTHIRGHHSGRDADSSVHLSFIELNNDLWKVVIHVYSYNWFPDNSDGTINPELEALGCPEWVYVDFDPVGLETAKSLWNDSDIWSYCELTDGDCSKLSTPCL